MGKRIAIILPVLLILLIAVVGYLFQQGKKTLFTDPFKAITPDACLVIETIDLQSFLNSVTTGKGLFGEAGQVKQFENFNRKVKFVADQLNRKEYKKLQPDGSAIISFSVSETGNPQALLSMTVPSEIRIRQVREILNSTGITDVSLAGKGKNSVLRIPYSINTLSDTLFIAINSGLLLCSSSAEVIDNAILQIEKETDVRMIPGFQKVMLASGKNEDKLFVVFANLQKLLKSVLDERGTLLSGKIVKLAGTAGGDIYINEDGLVLSGYTETIDSSELLYKYKSIPPKEFHTYKILPSATALFETLILPLIPSSSVASAKEDPLIGRTSDFAAKLKPFISEEITRVIIDIKERPVADNTLIIYELNNREQAEKLFTDESGSEIEILYFQPDDQIKIPVFMTPFKGLSEVLLPGFAGGTDDSYFTFYDNFLITGSSFATISRMLYDNLLNKTLANDLVYRDFETTLPSRAGYYFFCVPSRITEYLAEFLNEDIIKALKSNRESLNKIQAAGYQFASSNGMIYNSLSVRFKEEVREESTTEWETLLDTTAGIKPFFFTNHITGAKEIFIQDMKNNAYLINAAGRVLWKVPLNERIAGSIYMIDYFRNGKYQLLFSGRNYLHLLDRNGNYVERYPVKLRSPATNSLALFDYDNNLNYRLFIAGEDKLVYSYDKYGSVVKGWKPFRTSGFVNSEISYFKVSGKDYLVASDDVSLYFLDRTGNKRVTLQDAVSRSKGSSLKLNPGNEPYLVCTSPDGTIQNIYFDGTVKKITIKQFSVDHSFDIFDVDGNGFGEYIFIDKGILYLYDNRKSEMFSREFGSDQLGGPINFIFSSSERRIGMFDINKKLIYLIDKNGETMKGFPLRGASMFSIGKLSDKSGWHLIVGGTDRFLYNYKIDTDN
ncbi:MAG: WD40 repeat domain-containing protein [Bacteroidales bacterium]|nr:WD40 repeat domain-containing protein [Bacteroidales bacterium]